MYVGMTAQTLLLRVIFKWSSMMIDSPLSFDTETVDLYSVVDTNLSVLLDNEQALS